MVNPCTTRLTNTTMKAAARNPPAGKQSRRYARLGRRRVEIATKAINHYGDEVLRVYGL